MHVSQVGAQHQESVRIVILLIACAVVLWWRVTLVVIAIGAIALVGFGAFAVMHSAGG
jgi:hypothetical protein